MNETYQPQLLTEAQEQSQINQRLALTYGAYAMVGIGVTAVLYNLRTDFFPITSPFIFMPLWMAVALYSLPRSFKKLPKPIRQLLSFSSLLCVCTAVLFSMSPARACLGWLCGARDALSSSALLQGITGGDAALLTIWLALQAIAVLVLAGLVLWAIMRGLKEQDVSKPIVSLVVVLISLFISNYVASWIVGAATTGGTP